MGSPMEADLDAITDSTYRLRMEAGPGDAASCAGSGGAEDAHSSEAPEGHEAELRRPSSHAEHASASMDDWPAPLSTLALLQRFLAIHGDRALTYRDFERLASRALFPRLAEGCWLLAGISSSSCGSSSPALQATAPRGPTAEPHQLIWTLSRASEAFRRGGAEAHYQAKCQEVTARFQAGSLQVNKVEEALQSQEHGRKDLADILRAIQVCEKTKLHMTAVLQVLRKAGPPSQRQGSVMASRQAVGHACCLQAGHAVADEAGALGIGAAEAEAVGEATKVLQAAVEGINEHVEEVRYEVADLH
eukprot:SM000239S08069  [mRNA]  locus=s239:91833:93570:+ [translate_table: standard]